MKKIKEFIQKNWVGIVLILIVVGAVFVRVYKFEDWLYFRSDQVRDAKLAATAFEGGPGELALLGPRAAGTFLRLGPAFYYMQYASTVVFQSVEPHVLAFPDLILSVLTIPLLFYFLRQFFSIKNSLLITTLYSFSFIIIQYSRFAWNPNSISFFGLLFILSLYKASTVKNSRKAGMWFLLIAFSYAISSQLHFVSFVGYPVVAFLFWIFHFPKKVSWKYWVGGILIGLFFYVPVFLSDIKTGGDNLGQFIYAVTAKTGGEDNSLIDNLKQISTGQIMFLTSYGHKDATVSALAGVLLVLGGLGLAIYFWKTNKKSKPFVYLIAIWFLVFLALQIKTNTSLKPRFFMPAAAIPFILTGFGLAFMDKFKNKFVAGFSYALCGLILLCNLGGVKIAHDYFDSQDEGVIARRIFIKQDDAKVLKYHKQATDYMAREAKKEGKIACFYSGAVYERTYEYLFDVYHPDVQYDRISKSIEDKNACKYFSVITRDNKKLIGNSFKGYFDFIDSRKFGRIEVWNANAKDSFINYKRQEDPTRKENQVNKEKTDEDIQRELEESLKEAINNSEVVEEKAEKPDRVERVLWKHVFSGTLPE